MKTLADDRLGQMVEVIVREVDPLKVVVFGSQARGDAREDSDVDLLIVEDVKFEDGLSRWRELRRLRKSLASFRGAKDVIVFGREEYEKWRQSPNHIIAQALKEGEVLYERP